MNLDLYDLRRLVTIWWSCHSVREVADKTGFTETKLYQIAIKLRRWGVPLKRFKKGGKRGRAMIKWHNQGSIDELVRLGQECRDRQERNQYRTVG